MNDRIYMKPERESSPQQKLMARLYLLKDRRRELMKEVLIIDRELESTVKKIEEL